MSELKPVLDLILSRLGTIEENLGISSSANTEDIPKSIKAFDEYYQATVVPFNDICAKLGGDATIFGNLTADAWTEMHNFLLMASSCKEPPTTSMSSLLAPIANKMKEIKSSINRNDWENHGKTVEEGVSSLNWLVIKPAPRDYVESSVGGCDYHANKIRKEYRGKNDDQVAFCDKYKAIIVQLMDYIKEYHTTGVKWNKTPDAIDVSEYQKCGGTSPALAASKPVTTNPNPNPKPTTATTVPDVKAKANIFAALNKGTDITSGLKKVTKDQQTWRKEFQEKDSRSAPAPVAVSVPKSRRAPTGPTGTPRNEFVGAEKKHYVENQGSTCEITIERADTRVYIQGCVGAKVIIKGKVNSIFVDTCRKTDVVFETSMASCEVVNCTRMNVYVGEKVPSVAIDKTDGIVVHLPESSMDTNIVASKSSEMNLSWYDKNDELIEKPIPEQFIYKIDPKTMQVISEVSDLY